MKKLIRLLASGFLAAVFALAAQAAELAPGAYSAGSVMGDVTFKAPGESDFKTLEVGASLPQGAVIKTGNKSKVVIIFGSGSVASIEANSEVEVTKFEQALFSGPVAADAEPAVSNTEIRIIDGGVTSKVNKLKKGSSFSIVSPVGAAGVRGTVFRFFYDKKNGRANIKVTEGGVQFTDSKGVQTKFVGLGEKVEIEPVMDAGKIVGVTLSLDKMSADEIKQLVTALEEVLGEGTVTTKGNTIVITPVDTTQIGVSPN
jgi:hypothetical protein